MFIIIDIFAIVGFRKMYSIEYLGYSIEYIWSQFV